MSDTTITLENILCFSHQRPQFTGEVVGRTDEYVQVKCPGDVALRYRLSDGEPMGFTPPRGRGTYASRSRILPHDIVRCRKLPIGPAK